MQRPAFARFHAIMSVMAAAMANMPSLTRMEALQQAGGYESRGKGKGRRPHSKGNGSARVRRAAMKARNVQRNRRAMKS